MSRLFPLYSLLPLLLAACHPASLQLRINAPPGTNQDRPLYMLVRKVDAKQYAAESYGEVSARVIQEDVTFTSNDSTEPSVPITLDGVGISPRLTVLGAPVSACVNRTTSVRWAAP